jgi:hypothetical protein
MTDAERRREGEEQQEDERCTATDPHACPTSRDGERLTGHRGNLVVFVVGAG